MKRFNFILILIFILSLVFTSFGGATSIRMDELTDGSSIPPATSWYLIGYNGTTAYRMTYLSLLGVYFDAPGDAGAILYSDGSKWTRASTLSNVTIGGFTASKVICSDVSGSLIACTQLTDTAFSAYATLDTPTLITPIIGGATGTSLYTTGIIDGTVNVTYGSSGSTLVSDSNKTHYYFNNSGSSAVFTFTLPTAIAGLQYCFRNVNNASTPSTGIITINASTGDYIDLDGTNTASGGYINSAGAAADGVCVVSVNTAQWVAFPIKGTWTRH